MHDDSTRLQRANHVVSDLERALILYRDILGLAVEFMHESEADSYSYPVFEIDRAANLRFCVLSTATQPRVLALTEVTGIELPDNPMPRRSAIVLHVPDVDRILAECSTAGFKTYPEEQLVTNDGRTGREVGIVDDDGNLVVIYRIATTP